MAADWNKLADAYSSNAGVLIADVDCTASGKSLCDKHGIQGFPTIKFSDSSGQLQDYQQGRDYDSLLKFAQENLRPACSVSDETNCSEKDKSLLKKFRKMSTQEAEDFIAHSKQATEQAERTFKEELQVLQTTYSKLEQQKKEALDAVKASGLSLLKAYLAHKQKSQNKSADPSEDDGVKAVDDL